MNLFPLIMTLAIFFGCLKIYQTYQWPILNPLFWSIAAMIGLILLNTFSYDVYVANTQVINFFLGPATVVLAVPMYRQRALLKDYGLAIFAGILSSVILSAVLISSLCYLLGLKSDLHLSLLPKSITTPIGLSVSSLIGGIPALTVVSIILTGIIGAMFAPLILKWAGVHHPVAKGIGIGASSHVVGTSKALEMGEVEGAMSSLSIALAGIATYLFIPLYLKWFLPLLS